MKSISILKHVYTFMQQVDKLDNLLNWSSKTDHLPSQGGLRDELLPDIAADYFIKMLDIIFDRFWSNFQSSILREEIEERKNLTTLTGALV